MKIKYILGLLALCWQLLANAQQIQKIDDYNTKDGLLSNAVTSIFKDKNGFFWLKSYNTLQRWNGKHFFSEPIFVNADSLKRKSSKQDFFLIGTDLLHNYFLVDSNSKLYRTEHLEFPTTTLPEFLQAHFEFNALRDFFKATNNNSAYAFLKKSKKFACKTKDGFIVVDDFQNAYYADKKKGVLKLADSIIQKNITYFQLGNKIFLYENKNGRYKILENDSLVNKGKLTKEVAAKINHIGYGHNLGKNKCVAFTDGVLRKFELQENNSIIATDLLVLKDYEKYSCFYFDEVNNTLYIGSLTSGFSAYQLSNKHFNKEKNLQKENYVYSNHFVNNKLVNNIEFYVQFQNKQIPTWNWELTSAFCPINATSFLYANDDNVFVFTNKKIELLKIESRAKPLHHFVTTDSVLYLSRETIDRFYPKNKRYEIGNQNVWPTFDKQLYTIVKTEQPNIIYAVIGDELQALNMHLHATTTLAKGITGEPRSIDIDTLNNGLFISTKYGGCYYYKNNQTIKLPFVFNKKKFNPHYVLQDKEGDYWLPTNEGLYCMLKKDFTNYLSGKSTIISFKRFGKEDGLFNEEFNGGFQNAGLLFNDSIYLGTMDGTLAFHPSVKYTQKNDEGKLVLDYIKLDTTTIERTENIELPPDFKQFSIKADYPFIYNNGNLEYRLLGGNDTAWYNINATGLLEIKNLAAGAYTIEIRPTINSNKTIGITFKVKPYWYNTLWANLLFLVVLVVAIYIMFMWRWQTYKTNNLELINSSRTKFLATIVHDLRSPLNSYIGLADDIKYLIKKRDFDSIDKLGNAMDEKSRNLTLLVSNVLNWSNAEQGLSKLKIETLDVNEVLNEILPVYLDIANFRAIKVKVNIAPTATVKSDRNVLSLIVRNLIDNAIKHSNNGAIIGIDFYATDKKNIIEISNSLNDKQTSALTEISNVFKGTTKPEPHTNNLGLGIASVYNSCLLLKATIELNWDNKQVSFKLILPQ